MAIPGILVILFSTHLGFAQLQFQYSFTFAGGVFLAYLFGLKRVISHFSLRQNRRYHIRVKVLRYLRHSGSVKTVVVVPLIMVIILSPLLPVSQSLPAARTVNEFTPPGNLNAFNSMLSMMPGNATILASDFIFSRIAGDRNAYPILHTSVNGTLAVDDHLPANFNPKYILIFPSDYYSVEKIVKSFPSNYGVLAESMLNLSETNIINTFHYNDYVILYEIGYQGEAKLYEPAFNQFLSPDHFTINAGKIVSVQVSSFKKGVEVVNNGSVAFNILHGPSTASYAYTLLPGDYNASLYLHLFIENKTLSEQNSIGMQIEAYSNSYPLAWNQTNITSSSFYHAGIDVVTMHIVAYRPIFWFSVAIFDLKPGYGFIFYGAGISQNQKSAINGGV